jgi:DNA-binding winged helix-turn-helix (wHTH) protein/alpha-beta hydrolase superfamily lysophospholipase
MTYRFADCVLDPDRFVLKRDGAVVHVEPQVFDLLRVLLDNAGSVVSKDDLVDAVWNGLAVSDATINARLSAARKAVGDDGTRQAIIRTYQRRGFSVVCPVDRVGVSPDAARPERLTAPVDVRYTAAPGGPAIAWTATGQGDDVIRIGHWLSHLERDRSSPIFGPLLAHLSARHRLITYDVRGTGLSEPGAAMDHLDQFVDDLEAVADAACHGPATLMASSQAVPVAIAYAVRHPDRVRRLILCGGFAQGRALRPMQDGELDEPTAVQLIRTGWGRSGSVFLEAFARMFAPDGTPDQIADLGGMQRASADPETAVKLRHAIDRFDVAELLPQVAAPTLVLHARGDVIHPLSQGMKLAAGIGGARLITLDGRNHVLLPTSAAWPQAMAAIDTFLQADA